MFIIYIYICTYIQICIYAYYIYTYASYVMYYTVYFTCCMYSIASCGAFDFFPEVFLETQRATCLRDSWNEGPIPYLALLPKSGGLSCGDSSRSPQRGLGRPYEMTEYWEYYDTSFSSRQEPTASSVYQNSAPRRLLMLSESNVTLHKIKQ